MHECKGYILRIIHNFDFLYVAVSIHLLFPSTVTRSCIVKVVTRTSIRYSSLRSLNESFLISRANNTITSTSLFTRDEFRIYMPSFRDGSERCIIIAATRNLEKCHFSRVLLDVFMAEINEKQIFPRAGNAPLFARLRAAFIIAFPIPARVSTQSSFRKRLANGVQQVQRRQIRIVSR